MEASLGRGYSIHEDFGVTDFYSPPSSLIDETEEQDDDLFYPEDEEHNEQPSIVPTQETILPSSLIEEISLMNLSKSLTYSARLHSSVLNRCAEITVVEINLHWLDTATNTSCFLPSVHSREFYSNNNILPAHDNEHSFARFTAEKRRDQSEQLVTGHFSDGNSK